ncbi:MAG TPA: HAD family hydrolase [Bdellovibrionota bacterium]|nr:HAD family hydrolase [Bdellovibrionota bacterium]
MNLYASVLFDLDGTLTNPEEGVIKSLLFALERMGLPTLKGDELKWCIGPPFKEVLAKILGSDEPAMIDRALRLYRDRYRAIGMYENRPYPGIERVLSGLKNLGMKLYVATAKPHVFANPILEHFKLMEYFDGVYGAELDGTRTIKAALIAHVLKLESISPASAIMIGDREFDVIGARENGMPCIGVTYGHGSEAELTAAGALHLCRTPQDILEWFRKNGTRE